MSVLSDAGAPPGRDAGDPSSSVPVRADGLELIGELPGSGYREPPSLVRRGDGQTIQLTKLLYLVLSAVDGRRTDEEIAAVVSAQFGRLVRAADVQQLCDGKLRTLGLLRLADGSDPELKRSNPLLALRFKYVVSDPAVTRRITAPFSVLFAPAVVTVVLLAFLVVCAWVFVTKGLASATHQAFEQPGLLLAVFALTVLSAGFHEFGHAAAARYGGATPGAMGTGLYLVWPAFYTDVTDSYRLGKAGRVRTDLGGLYFNAIVAVLMFGVWWVTRYDAVLLIIGTQVLQMLRQLAPLVRFDGYHVLADLTGVPDLYHRIKPTLLGLLPNRWSSPEARVLKPWARTVVSVWVLVVVPILLGSLAVMILTLPRVAGTALAALGRQWRMLSDQLAAGDILGVLVRLLSVLAIALPVLGVVYIVSRVVRQVVTQTLQSTRDRPVRRGLAGVVAAAIVAALVWAWWPDPGAYRPIQPYERGTIQDAVPSFFSSAGPVRLQEGRQATARTLLPKGTTLPGPDRPQLAMVLVPRAEAASTAPTWVFPFNRPEAPAPGDNQALAVNTTNGSTVYDVAFALVWADGSTVANTNEAYAFASCTACQTVAVAFQVILIVGHADVIVPQNLSGAVNYSCRECLTEALATQLVLTLNGPLTEQSMAQLNAVWAEIASFGATLQGLPLTELQGRIADYEKRILAIVQADPSATPATGNAATGTATSTATATPVPSGGATSSTPTRGGSATAPGSPATSTAAVTSGPTSTAATTGPSVSSPSAGPTASASPTATSAPSTSGP